MVRVSLTALERCRLYKAGVRHGTAAMALCGFANTEEAAVQLTDVVPFLLEDELKSRGGNYSKKVDWASYVVKDGLLITGQNPASSEEAARELVKMLS